MNLLDLFVRVGVDDQASGAMDGISAGMIAKGQLIATGITSAISKAVQAIQSLFSSIIGAYSEYEQLAGGIETFFGSAADTVISNSKKAYETAGMSANQYMSTVSSFATALVNGVAQQGKQTAQVSQQAAEDSSKAFSRSLSDQLDELRSAQQDFTDARREAQQEELDNLRDSQAEEVKEFQKATDAKIKEINREYTEKMKLVDEEEYRRLKALQDQIDGLENQGKAAKEQAEERERAAKIAALKEKEANSLAVEDIESARKELSELRAKYAAEDAEKERKSKIDSLKDQQKDVREEASEERTRLREEQQNVVEDYRSARQEELEELQKSHQQELKEVQKLHADELKELQRAQADELKAAQRHNEDLLAERKRALESMPSSEFIKATEEDQQRAAELADRAIIDMADNANKMGTSMDMIQNAYQGFAKGNFTMLDNLKLGFGGTKEEMERLLETAEQIQAKNGEVADYSIDNFADIVEAIHVVQQEYEISGYKEDELKQKIEDRSLTEQELARIAQDLYKDQEDGLEKVKKAYEDGTLSVKDALILTGTTSNEASTTIQGALNSAGGAWENFLVALVDPDYDAGEAAKNLAETIGTAAGLIAPKVATAAAEILKVVQEKGPEIVEEVKNAFLNALPEEDRKNLEDDLKNYKDTLDGMASAAKTLSDAITAVGNVFEWFGTEVKSFGEIAQGVNGFLDATPGLIQAAFGNPDALNDNGKAIVEGFVNGAEYQWDFEGKGFFENIAGWIKEHKGPEEADAVLLTDNGAAIINGLISGARGSWEGGQSFFTNIAPWLLGVFGGSDNWLVGSGNDVMGGLGSGVNDRWGPISGFFSDIGNTFHGFFNGSDDWLTGSGNDVMGGLFDGVEDVGEDVFHWFSRVSDMILDSIGDMGNLLFGAGRDVINGFWEGLSDAFGDVQDWVLDIGDWIANNKGPKQYDLGLLVPNGKWIMQGLASGMREAFPLIEQTVSDVTGLMDVGMPNMSITRSQLQANSLPPVNIYMTYNAGDDAKQLVTDMVGQLRRYGYTMGGRR